MHRAVEDRFTIVALDLGIDLDTEQGSFLASVPSVASTWHPRGVGRRMSFRSGSGGTREGLPPAAGEPGVTLHRWRATGTMGEVGARADTTRRSSIRRLYGPTLVVGLLAALGVTVGASHSWVTATSTPPGLPTIHAAASGADLAPLAAALGVAVLAAFGAVIATRGWVRRGLGAAIVVASVVVVVSAADPSGASEVLTSGLSAKGWSGGGYQSSTEPWRWLVLLSAVVTAVAGAATAGYGDQWAVMGQRYDAPRAPSGVVTVPAEELTENDVWQAIDQGRDPTRDI
jgi:uncharacterized membrane protein (TIGR02234 family)